MRGAEHKALLPNAQRSRLRPSHRPTMAQSHGTKGTLPAQSEEGDTLRGPAPPFKNDPSLWLRVSGGRCKEWEW